MYNDAGLGEQLNRLTKATINDGSGDQTFIYRYDPAGNLTSMTVPYFGMKTFSYDADNRITNSGFSYDSNGNLTAAAMYGTNYQYVYDSANRLIEVKDGAGASIATYTYDGVGRRLTKTAKNSSGQFETTTYHYFQGEVLYETNSSDPANVVRARYTRTPDGKLLGVRLYKPVLQQYYDYYYHYNAQGDIVAVTDTNGNVYRQYVYDPYGNIISVKDGSGNAINIGIDPEFNHAYTYRGYRFDPESGLYFLNSRYYAAGIGRFLTKDSVLGNDADPQSLNRYAYAEGDPITFVDPTGHSLAIPIGLGGLGVGLGTGIGLGTLGLGLLAVGVVIGGILLADYLLNSSSDSTGTNY